MCLILVGWQSHPTYPLVVAANRDEFHTRPSTAAAFWQDAPHVFAGRDLQAGGTWLGMTRGGRFAALTNFREGRAALPGAPSRGSLVANFLRGQQSISAYLEDVQPRCEAYGGFNLLLGDGERLACFSNRQAGVQWLAPGIYGLSNHLLDTLWPKLAAAKTAFAQALDKLPLLAPCFELLADREIVADAHLPETGVPLAWERVLSAIFVAAPEFGYGTRASTVLSARHDGQLEFVERSFAADGRSTGQSTGQWIIGDDAGAGFLGP